MQLYDLDDLHRPEIGFLQTAILLERGKRCPSCNAVTAF